jgi:hypothetical protein
LTGSRKDDRASVLFAIVLCCAAVLGLWKYTEQSRGIVMYDFRAFYCGASVAIRGGDPYRQEPLYSCEARRDGSWLMNTGGNVAVPAPFPGYVLALFVPLSGFPFPLASIFWLLVLCFALGWTVEGLRRLTRFNVWALTALVFSTGGVLALTLGQLTPVAVAGLVWAAVAVEEQRYGAAAVALAFAALEPHVALGAIVSLFVWKRAAQVPLILLAAVIVGTSIAFLGYARAVEYVTQVVPMHAQSELRYPGQLALSPLLYNLGIDPNQAVRIGSLQWVIVVVAGIVTAARVAGSFDRDSLLVLWPAGVALVGGVFLHAQQIAFIVPLAAVIAATPNASPVAKGALVALSVPWIPAIMQPALLGVGALALFLVAWLCVRLSLRACLLTTAGFLLLSLVGFHFVHQSTLVNWSALPASLHFNAATPAEVTWQAAMSTYNYGDIGMSVGRLVTWAALIVAIWAVASQPVRAWKQ